MFKADALGFSLAGFCTDPLVLFSEGEVGNIGVLLVGCEVSDGGLGGTCAGWEAQLRLKVPRVIRATVEMAMNRVNDTIGLLNNRK
jgi:hypothetical protein